MVHPADKQELVSGSIAHTIALLSLWSKRPSRGLAKVEFTSEFSRQNVVKGLRYQLQGNKIAFYEIKLPVNENPSLIFNFLLEELNKLEFGVVSISGFETAFSDKDRTLEGLRILNYNRENLAQFNLRQIWWMSWSFNSQVIGMMPDLNSWFSLRLYLTETLVNTQRKENTTKLRYISDDSFSPISQDNNLPHNLPSHESTRFVGREATLRELHKHLHQSEEVAICCLTGMGGVGKTKLALEYAWQQWEKKTYTGGICWLNSLNQELGLQILSFARNYLQIKIPEDGTLSERVRYCWHHWPPGDVLIIFDDVRDYGKIESYLPPSGEKRFKVIVTIRFNYIGVNTTTINLDVLTEAEAIELLKVYVDDERIEKQIEEVKLLCQNLGYLPLALELVGRFLVRRPNWTFKKIREKLTANLTQDDNFHGEIKLERRIKEAFEISWHKLNSQPLAQKLAMYLSLFALVPFSKSWVNSLFPGGDEVEKGLIEELVNFGLVQDLGNDWYELHTLIHRYFRDKLEVSEYREDAKKVYCALIVEICKDIPQVPIQKDIEKFAPSVEHIKVVTDELYLYLEDKDLIWPFIGLGRFYEGQALYSAAEPYYYKCLQLSQQQLGYHHPDVATSLNNLALLYNIQGRYTEAEPLYTEALEMYRRMFEGDHPSVAQSLNNLAILYYSQGRYSEAESLYKEALEIYRRILERDYTSMATSLNNLALLHKSQWRYSKAEHLYTEALEIYRRIFEGDCTFVATSLNNLANLYRSQGRYSEAEPLFTEALEMYKGMFSGNHPDIASSLNNLANLYYSQGRYTEAEPLFTEALEMYKGMFSGNHPDVATGLNNLANLYKSQGRYSEAESLFTKALKMTRKIFENNHPYVATSLNNLANLYKSQGRYSEAESLLTEALDMIKKIFESDHPYVATSLNNLANLYKSQGRYSEAEPMLTEALDMIKKIFEGDHPNVATSLNNLANLYDSQGKYSEAEYLYTQALEMYRRIFKDDHPDVATSLNNLAHLYNSQGRYSEAEPLYTQALEMKIRMFKGDHPSIATSLNNLAHLYNSQGRYSEAEYLYTEALEMYRRMFEGDHPDVAESLNSLAELYRSQGKYNEAEPLYIEALQIAERSLGINHPTTQTIRKNLVCRLGFGPQPNLQDITRGNILS